MSVLNTQRLTLDRFTAEDVAFVLELVNEPAFHAYIGDRGVRTLDDARRYIDERLIAHYAAHGFGFWRVSETASGTPIGMCGLARRETLEHVDIGFAMLKRHEGKGYAYEAAAATLAYARDVLGLDQVVAIVVPDNARSTRLLTRLGMARTGAFTWPDDGVVLDVYSRVLSDRSPLAEG